MIEIDDPDLFFRLQDRLDFVPFTQSAGWHRYQTEQGKKIAFFVDNKDNPNFSFWGRVLRLPFGLKILQIEGEGYSGRFTEKAVKNFYEKLIQLKYHGYEINSCSPHDVEYEIGIRRAGFIRPLGFFSCPLSILFYPQREFNFSRNWKRNVAKADKNGLTFAEIEKPDMTHAKVFEEIFNKMAEFKHLRYRVASRNLLSLMKSADMRVFMVAGKRQAPLAARIIYTRAKFGADVYAANSSEARDTGATYFLMERIFSLLRDEGYECFDFARIPPSARPADNVYLFKNSSRGEKIQYNGEWSFYKKKYLRYLMYGIKKYSGRLAEY